MKCNKCNNSLPDDSLFCQYCGSKIEKAVEPVVVEQADVSAKAATPVKQEAKPIMVEEKPSVQNGFAPAGTSASTTINTNVGVARASACAPVRKAAPKNKLVMFTNILSVVLSAIAMLAIVIAMNVQDSRRNVLENWNTTAVYVVLLLIIGAFLGFAISSLVKKRFKLIAWLSTIPVAAAIITGAEGSVLEDRYYYSFSYKDYYNNSEAVDVFNIIWITCVVFIFIITLIPVVVATIKKISNNWHHSISYRERCYKRVAKIHSYLEKGIITEEEYEKTKNDILKRIQ